MIFNLSTSSLLLETGMKPKDESNVLPSPDLYFISRILSIKFKIILVLTPVNSGKTLKSTHLLYAHDIKDTVNTSNLITEVQLLSFSPKGPIFETLS